MANAAAEQLAAALWRAASESDLAACGDAELLDRYAACGDDRAFRALVGRHAPVVWDTCARSLRSPQDAEDAFQATFIALARRARAGVRVDVLPAWLREVAKRAARDVRRSAARRHEVHMESIPDTAAREPTDPRELAAVLEEELGQLPEPLRRPLELCRFEGRTYADAARILGCSVATVCRRVEQAADALRGRLSRRGLLPAGSTAGVVFAGTTTAHGVPPGLAARAADVAIAAGAGKPTSALLVATADAALRSGGIGPVKLVGFALLAAVGGVGGLVLAQGVRLATPPVAVPSPAKPVPRVDTLKEPLPAGAVARIDTVRDRKGIARGDGKTPTDVMSVAFSTDGRTLATVTSPGPESSIRVWNATTGKLTAAATVPADSKPVAVQLTESGYTALTTSTAGANRLHWAFWEATRGTRLTPALPDGVTVTAMSPDGQTVAAVHADRVVITDAATGAERERFATTGTIDSLAFSADGDTLTAHSKWPEGAFVAWYRIDNRWQPIGPGVTPLRFRTGRILATSPDGRYAAVPCDGAFADPILVHDLSTGAVAGSFEVGGGPFALAFSPDSRAVAATNEGSTVRVWEVASGRRRRDLPGHDGKILSVAFSPNGRRLASGSADGTVLIWNLESPARPIPAGDAELLAALGGPDAAVGYDAVLTLAAQPGEAVRLLRPLLVSPRPDDADAARWVRELGAPDPAVRRQAADALEKHGRSVEIAIHRGLADPASEEVRLELVRFNGRLNDPRSSRRLTEARGLEALERSGTVVARELLTVVAAAYPDAPSGRDAAAALRRLGARTGPGD